mmetsp:Transcript_21628/g.46767  ORF Transcript_21628/g.46767 Transcript_21628/m.46767 type:complete len:579 (+) Transcript_21628:452-2188(+)
MPETAAAVAAAGAVSVAVAAVAEEKVRPKVSVSLGLGFAGKKKKKKGRNSKNKKAKAVMPMGDDDDDAEDENAREEEKKVDPALEWNPASEAAAPVEPALTPVEGEGEGDKTSGERPKKRSRRWDGGATAAPAPTSTSATTTGTADSSSKTSPPTHESLDDALDRFMDQFEAGATGQVSALDIDVGGTMQLGVRRVKLMQMQQMQMQQKSSISGMAGGVITAEELARLHSPSGAAGRRKRKMTEEDGGTADSHDDGGVGLQSEAGHQQQAMYTHSDWESDANAPAAAGAAREESASEAETDNEEEEKARRAFLEALKKTAPITTATTSEHAVATTVAPQIKSEVLSEKHRREQRIRDLETEALTARKNATAETDFGRMYNDADGGVMEEAERNLAAVTAAPDALEVLAELNKKKELKAVDHGRIDYLQIRKNLFVVPRSLANLSEGAVDERRAELHIRVRGKGAPAPVGTFRECGLSERIMTVLESQDITNPFPVQAQCMPCIMAGRDVIGIAKTGSGKTLAYLLPMLRHIMDQPPLQPGESGPIGLVLAPARELAFQIHNVCKVFAKNLGLNLPVLC